MSPAHLRPRRPTTDLTVTVLAVGLVLLAALGAWRLTDQDDTSSAGGPAPLRDLAAGPAPVAAAAPDEEDAEDETSRGAARIREENARPGNPEWPIDDGDERPRGAEGFTDRVSGQQGDTVRLYVDTRAPSFLVTAYRLGHYGGAGARQVWQSPPIPGRDQPDCEVVAASKMVDCSNWAPSLSVAVGDDWLGGQYLFKLVPTTGSASFVPFVVRDDRSRSDVLVISDVTTLQAYNRWGGHSLYGGDGGRSTVVSFDRPMDTGWAMSGILGDSYNVGVMVESLGLDVSYTTNVDQHARPELMRDHKVIVSGVHDEYYSLEMRDGLEAARDAGVNIVFLGANAVYRRIRLEPSLIGPYRHQVNYRSADADPLNGVDPDRVTTSWREGPAARPESSLTGTYYECNEGGMRADMVIVDAAAWMFEGTNVTSGQHWPDVVREEYDRVTPSAPTPPGIQVLAHSPLTCRGEASHSDMAYYTAPGGAGVLNTGTLGFEPRLGPLCAPADLTPARWECQLRQMVANVVTDFATGPAGDRHPSQPNLAELGIR
ncbi:MAG TPA: N,N-dimethylformamidase beta subunit family domain-containing protein [Acidimicrobiales bacterium]|nr:N,N-dimethylformamidase beta subunit family domain-containing protein [Acidimicrobiales bacterium]